MERGDQEEEHQIKRSKEYISKVRVTHMRVKSTVPRKWHPS